MKNLCFRLTSRKLLCKVVNLTPSSKFNCTTNKNLFRTACTSLGQLNKICRIKHFSYSRTYQREQKVVWRVLSRTILVVRCWWLAVVMVLLDCLTEDYRQTTVEWWHCVNIGAGWWMSCLRGVLRKVLFLQGTYFYVRIYQCLVKSFYIFEHAYLLLIKISNHRKLVCEFNACI